MKCSQCLTGEVVAVTKVNNVFYVLCEECEMKLAAKDYMLNDSEEDDNE